MAGWAHEMRAWFSPTTHDYRSVVAAAQAGTEAAPHHGATVQLAAQETKAWARLGDRQVAAHSPHRSRVRTARNPGAQGNRPRLVLAGR